MAIAKQGGRWLIIATTFVAAYEGIVHSVAPDPIGIPTWCYGVTRGDRPPVPGHYYTTEECKGFLQVDLQKYFRADMKCLRRGIDLSDERIAAIVSFSYNVGTAAFCRSTFARKLNAGDPKACDELLKWNHAGGMVFRGLTRRREAERKLCLVTTDARPIPEPPSPPITQPPKPEPPPPPVQAWWQRLLNFLFHDRGEE